MPDGSHGRFIGRTLSHYRVSGPLGSGGMGVVYRGEDVRLGRPVAIKFVADDFADDAQAIARLNAEAKAASALNHPNICTIYDIGTEEGHPFIVMELMEGQTLRERLTRGLLKVHELVDVGIQAADALQGAHSANIVHRDIKPANIFITGRGHVKILDFGLAKLAAGARGANSETIEAPDLTAVGTTIGTVSYMSPEQATDEDLDGRTDLFSLGVVLYECATGRQPFEGKVPAVILAAILNRAPVLPTVLNPELPVRLQDVIMTCLEKDREMRYQSAADLRADLKRIRRDLESGRTHVGQQSATMSLTDSDRHLAQQAATKSGGSAAAVSVAGTASGPASTTTPAASRTALLVGGAAVVLAVVAGVLFMRRPVPEAPAASAAVAPQEQTAPPASGTDRLALAESSLAARNFRAAQAYAAEVLTRSPENADARRVREEATAALSRIDQSLALARQRLQQNDVQGASRALATARDIDPTDAAVIEFTTQLTDHLRSIDSSPLPKSGSAPARPPAPPAPVAGRGLGSPAPPASAPVAAPAPNLQAPPIAQTPTPLPVPQAPPVPEPEPTRAPRPSAPPPEEPRVTTPAAPSRSDDEAAIRRVVASYGRAIETKDISLFRSVKPNLSRDEERRLQDGFRAVASQQVRLTVQSVDLHEQTATVVAQRHDQIDAGGRRQNVDSRQTFTLARTSSGWTITDIR